jgi:hypothetical protein
LFFHDVAVETSEIGTDAEKQKLSKLSAAILQQKESGVDDIQRLRKLLDLSADFKGCKDDAAIRTKLGLFRWMHTDGHCVWIGGDEEAKQRAKDLNYSEPAIGPTIPANLPSVASSAAPAPPIPPAEQAAQEIVSDTLRTVTTDLGQLDDEVRAVRKSLSTMIPGYTHE